MRAAGHFDLRFPSTRFVRRKYSLADGQTFLRRMVSGVSRRRGESADRRSAAAAALSIAMLPSSIHESGVPPFAPASMSAIPAATGKRIPA